jgi:predicted kinase
MAIYQQFLTEADKINFAAFTQLIEEGKDIILDRSFYAKDDRDKFSEIIARLGGRRVLVVFRLEKELLWKRITERAKQPKNANNALDISRELFETYWDAFEWPDPDKEEIILLS